MWMGCMGWCGDKQTSIPRHCRCHRHDHRRSRRHVAAVVSSVTSFFLHVLYPSLGITVTLTSPDVTVTPLPSKADYLTS